jgi:DNA primase
MCNISNTTGSNSSVETSWEDGDTAETFIRQNPYKGLIYQANSISIVDIFRYYGLFLDENNRKCICPFTSHNGGKENTASFLYYPSTNSFFCFGCKIGGSCSEFVSAIENISKINAANKILSIFDNNCSYDIEEKKQDFFEQLDIMLEFSNFIREFREIYTSDKSFNFIENICKIYDNMRIKHNLNNDALRLINKQLKFNIDSYID